MASHRKDVSTREMCQRIAAFSARTTLDVSGTPGSRSPRPDNRPVNANVSTSIASSAEANLPVACPGLQSPLYVIMRSVKIFSAHYENEARQTVWAT